MIFADARRGSPGARANLDPAHPVSGAKRDADPAMPFANPRSVPWIFAAKTTASGLLALLVAFTFNLDQPKWALLTVFIVAQPQSGLVLAKSFYRIIGTLIGASGALFLISLFAQERVLFLGTLAIWIGVCTFASKQARNFAAYGFVLSGYTVAIVGIPGALDPGNAYFIAVARVTEISLGIMTTAAISHLVFPVSLAASLRRAVATSRGELADYAAALLGGRDTVSQRTKLLSQVIAMENLHASAVFEDREIQERSGALRRLDTAMLSIVDIGHLLSRSRDWLRNGGVVIPPRVDEASANAAVAIDLWRGGTLGAACLGQHLRRANADLPLVRELHREPLRSDAEIIECAALIGRLSKLLTTIVVFAEAYEAFLSGGSQPVRPLHFAVLNDRIGALWAGLRAALAVVLVSTFWILADWPSGVTASILAGVVTARLATMEHAVQAAMSGALLFALMTIPCFILVEVLLPDASGFAMFTLVVAPMLFCCAYLMAHAKTAGMGFLAGLYFANTAGFQDRMAYDPVGFINTSIAITLAVATAGVLFAIVAPDTPQAARRRFVRIARKAFERIAGQSPRIGGTEFETAIAEALDQLQRGLGSGPSEDVAAAVEAGITFLGAGRELIGVRDRDGPTPATIEVAAEIVRFLASNERPPLDRALRAAQDASARCLAELRDDRLGVAVAPAVAREMVAFAAIRDELERGGELLLDQRAAGPQSHVT